MFQAAYLWLSQEFGFRCYCCPSSSHRLQYYFYQSQTIKVRKKDKGYILISLISIYLNPYMQVRLKHKICVCISLTKAEKPFGFTYWACLRTYKAKEEDPLTLLIQSGKKGKPTSRVWGAMELHQKTLLKTLFPSSFQVRILEQKIKVPSTGFPISHPLRFSVQRGDPMELLSIHT